jgi:hypothetical protein
VKGDHGEFHLFSVLRSWYVTNRAPGTDKRSITQQVFAKPDKLFEYPERSMIGVYGKYL